MSHHNTQPGGPTASNNRSTSRISSTVSNTFQAQQEAIPNTTLQVGITQHLNLPPPPPPHHDGLGEQHNGIQRWYWPWGRPQINPNYIFIDINPNTQEVVPKDFIEQAFRNDAKLRKIEEALKEKVQECDEIKEHWQAAVGELNDLKSSKQKFVVDDAEMTAKWKSLQYAIKNLARTYFCNLIPLDQLSHNKASFLRGGSPLYQQILSTEGQVHLLFQSLIWKYITEGILRNPTIVWGENLSAAFTTLLKVGWNSAEDYHAWRAQTGEMIQCMKGVHDRQRRQLKRELRKISQFMPEDKLSNEKYAMIFRHSVEEIIDKAIELAIIFNQSWSAYEVEVVSYGKEFDSTMMEYGEECNAPRVDLMVSPALIKFGNSRGKNYDQWLVLAKSHVHSFVKHPQEEEDKEDCLIDC
ncbi:hypothetical protein GQX73_g8076 [Xylaria multiplex]|uniref:Uncharacterized protein n=1 Tax=Xylaria multiplex TaxID=323545 RepID=A0A7C8MIF9_9PEZI|nr:hypothetical protein GQX73_g8076 [Xylaria multiplex]